MTVPCTLVCEPVRTTGLTAYRMFCLGWGAIKGIIFSQHLLSRFESSLLKLTHLSSGSCRSGDRLKGSLCDPSCYGEGPHMCADQNR